MTTKSDIISTVSANTSTTKTAAETVINSFLNTVAVELANGNEVNLPGFGKFTLSEREARQGRNPATGESIQIAASTSVKFKPAKDLKEAL